MRVEGEQERFYDLLSSSYEEQIRLAFELLLSLDDRGLCEVLHGVDGQLRVREDIVVCHRLLWEKCILEEVMTEERVWHDLYVGDYFRSLEVHVLGNTYWEKAQEQSSVCEQNKKQITSITNIKPFRHLSQRA